MCVCDCLFLGRNSIKKDQYLTHLVLNPDPTPCPPLVVPDASLLREGLTLKVGGLAGFDMSVWENSIGEEGGGGGERKKVSKLGKKTKTISFSFFGLTVLFFWFLIVPIYTTSFLSFDFCIDLSNVLIEEETETTTTATARWRIRSEETEAISSFFLGGTFSLYSGLL